MSIDSSQRRVLRVVFASEEEFQREYSQNIANGGIFLNSSESFELREPVTVEICLAFQDELIEIEGEVVSVVPGIQPGVAVQLSESASVLRERLCSLAGIGSSRRDETAGNPWRASIRHTVRVYARVECEGEVVGGCTRDLSQSGVLVMVDGPLFPIGRVLCVALMHPLSGAEFEARGTVVRHVSLEGGRKALGIVFDWGEANCQAAIDFLKSLREVEETNRGADVTGDIAAVGVPNILQMLASCTPRGTALFCSGGFEGRIIFEEGNFLDIRSGEVSGPKALARLCEWTEGEFSFSREIDPAAVGEDPPLPVYGALLEAAAQADELNQNRVEVFPPNSQLTYCPGVHDGFVPEGQVEEALIELAQAEFQLAVVLDIIPESDAVIHNAVSKLRDLGIIKVESD